MEGGLPDKVLGGKVGREEMGGRGMCIGEGRGRGGGWRWKEGRKK